MGIPRSRLRRRSGRRGSYTYRPANIGTISEQPTGSQAVQPKAQKDASVKTPTGGENEIVQLKRHARGCAYPACTRIQRGRPLIQKVPDIQMNNGLTDEERYVNTLNNAGTTRAAWDAGYINHANFMGVNITRGIHQELADRLTLAEAWLRGQHPGRTDEQIANDVGLNTISGRRSIGNAVGGSRLSNHSYGIAIDVNYSANPFIGRSSTVNDIINRISQLMTGNSFEIRTVQAGTNEEIRARFAAASQAFADYFSMRGDRAAIRQLVTRRGLVSTPEPPEGLIDPWREEEIDQWVQEIHDQIEADATNPTLLGEMEMTNIGPRPLTGGFIDLSEQLVEALTNHAGLYWGANYRTGKDIMHFDWRNGTIRTQHRE